MKKNTFHYQSYKNVDSILGNNALDIALYGYKHFSFLKSNELFIVGFANLLIIIKPCFIPKLFLNPRVMFTDWSASMSRFDLRKGAPSRGLWMRRAGSFWHKRAGVATSLDQ